MPGEVAAAWGSAVTQGADPGDQAALPASFRVGVVELPAWPDAQVTEPMSASLMAATRFADHGAFHPALIEATLAAEQDTRFRDTIFKGGCGIKVRDVAGWGASAANLIHARALQFAHRTLSRNPVFSDATWASVYRAGDYCMPHSHLRSNASIVYMLDTGDEDADDALAGRLCFADPRIDVCCPDEPGRVTQHLMPPMSSGTMLIFASDYLHSVNPYRGQRPRITMSWNITLQRLSGRAGEGWKM